MNNSPGQSAELRDLAADRPATRRDDLESQGPTAPSMLEARSNQSTAFLDGLRGLAALSVVIQHYIGSFTANIHEHGFGEDGNYHLASLPFVRIVFSGGNAAVAIFFVLSGYVLSRSPLGLVRKNKQSACASSLLSAIIRRPIRLYVPPLGVAFVYAMLMHAPMHIVPDVPWPQPKENVFAEAANWLFESINFFNPFQSHGSANHAWYTYNLVAWTIPIELKGSMLIYAVLAVISFSRLSRPVIFLGLAVSSFVLLQLGAWTMACFLAGLILALVDINSMDGTWLARLSSLRAESTVLNVVFLVGYYLLCQPAHASKPEYSLNTPGWYYLTVITPKVYDADNYYRYWHSWGSVLLVYSSLRITWLQNFLGSQPLRYLGKISFMLYLVHLPLNTIVGERLMKMLGNISDDAPYSWWNNKLYIPNFGPVGMSSRFIATLVILLPLNFAISGFATKVLDMPSVKASKFLVRRLGLEQNASKPSELQRGGLLK